MSAASSASAAAPSSDLSHVERVPGVFRSWELSAVLVPGHDFLVEDTGPTSPGTPLFTVYRLPGSATAGVPARSEPGARRAPASATPPVTMAEPQARSATEPAAPVRDALPPIARLRPTGSEPSHAKLKSRHRDEHLCLRCQHHQVCGMANALDANLLVTIASCLGYEPADLDDPGAVCELMPLEPMPTL